MQTFYEFQFSFAFNNEFVPSEYTGEIYHYTSSSGFQSILFGENHRPILWASRYDCLNDISEGTVAEKVLQEALHDLLTEQKISGEAYHLFSSTKAAHRISVFRRIDDKLSSSDSVYNRFICSFSKNSDSLSMWNYYAKDNKYEGFNIGFDCESIRETLHTQFDNSYANFHIYPVIYDSVEQRRLVEGLVLRLNEYYSEENGPIICELIADRLAVWNLIFKNAHFKHEEEVRIIIDLANDEPNIATTYRINARYIIPYIQLELAKDDLLSVRFGPLHKSIEQAESQEYIMNEWLLSSGYHDVHVSHSNIPIRY